MLSSYDSPHNNICTDCKQNKKSILLGYESTILPSYDSQQNNIFTNKKQNKSLYCLYKKALCYHLMIVNKNIFN